MKITPLEIRQKSFEKVLRGYDKDEVNAFLLSLSQEWERTLDEAKELRIKYESAEREVTKLREVESSLYKTLKTAEDTGANVIDQANKAAELHLKETQLKAEAIMNEARTKARNTLEETEQASREVLEEMEDRLRKMVEDYKSLQSQRSNLLSDLKRAAAETLDRVERVKNEAKDFDPDQHLSVARREMRRTIYPNNSEEPAEKRVEQEEKKVEEVPEPVLEEATRPIFEEKKEAPKSFFDDIQ